MPSPEIKYAPEAELPDSGFLVGNFSGHDEFERALETGTIVEICPIEEKFPNDVPEHLNEVDWAKLKPGEEDGPSHRCKVLDIKIQADDGTIEAIFKPASGEDGEAKRVVGIQDAYKSEVAAYLVDKALKLGLVPPTIIKEIGGETGSLQLFIDPSIAKYHGLDFEHLDTFEETPEWQFLAAFDYLVANPDRSKGNGFNLLFSNNPQDPHIFAIDHGLCFSHAESQHLEMAKGPRRNLAAETNPVTKQATPRNMPLPAEFHERVAALINNPEELINSLREIGLGEDFIAMFWVRARKMAEAGVFL